MISVAFAYRFSRLAILLLFLATLFTTSACGPVRVTIGSRASDSRLTETVIASERGPGRAKIVVIDVDGFLVNAERPGLLQTGENPVAWLDERLARAASDRRVAALVLRVNSPGGTVTASDMMARSLTRFREATGKPVVVLMTEVAASGGYYISASADHLVAHPTTITGSIGVVVQTVSFKPALDRLGIRAKTYRSGEVKDAGSPLSDPNPAHDPVFEALVEQFFGRFTDWVIEHRPQMTEAHRERVFDGRVISGLEALELGLIDELGDLEEAWHAAKRLANVDRADLVIYHRQGRPVGRPYLPGAEAGVGSVGRRLPDPSDGGDRGLLTSPSSMQINLLQINFDASLPMGGSGFYYLWLPGDR